MQDSLEDYLLLSRGSGRQEGSVKISTEMVVTAQMKKECDARAMKIVEFSIEGKMRPEVFTKCLPFINQSHYQDIVEERAITKLCGYSVCGKRIPEMPKKQYLILTKSNKVYDITERKNFCSNFCYKASVHIKKQIDNSPLWLRKLEDIPEYRLLHISEGGLPGEYIDQGVVKPVEETMFTSITSFAQASLGEMSEREPPGRSKNQKTSGFKKSSLLKSTMQTIKENVVEEENTVTTEPSKPIKRPPDLKKSIVKTPKKDHRQHRKHCIVSLPSIEENEEKTTTPNQNNSKENECTCEQTVIDKTEVEEEEEATSSAKRLEEPNAQTLSESSNNIKINLIKPEGAKNKKTSKKRQKTAADLETIIKNALSDWLTLETCIFIHGEAKVKLILTEAKLTDCFEQLRVHELRVEQQMRYMEVCRRLQLQEMAEEMFDRRVTGKQLKPLPDFKRLKDDTKDMKLKVKSFYQGTMYEEDDKNFPVTAKVAKEEEEEDEEGPPAVLPPVDVHSHNLLRRKILLNSLSKAIQQLLQVLGASYSAVLSDVQALVKTFNLRADNITFKPLVWSYIALVLLHLLSLKDEALRELLEEKRSREYVRVLLDSLPSKSQFLSDALCDVKDIETFVTKYVTKKDDGTNV